MGNKKVQTNVGGDDIAAKLASVPLASVTNLKLLFSISFIGLSKKKCGNVFMGFTVHIIGQSDTRRQSDTGLNHIL